MARNSFFKSFVPAFQGIKLLVKERNFRVQLVIGTVVLCSAIYINVDRLSVCVLLICTFSVLALEAVNSSIERLCDFVHSEHHVQIKFIKDISAGAVLIASIISLIIGIVIFLPYLSYIFN